MFFKKKKETIVYSPAQGPVLALEKVNDPVFSQKMMGDGFAVSPTKGTISAPVEGIVSSIFPTKHALGIQTKDGLEILIHIGIDTVELNGTPFKIFVSEGDKVTPNTHIADVDLDYLEKKGKNKEIMVIITNMEIVKKIDFKLQNSQSIGDIVAVVYQ